MFYRILDKWPNTYTYTKAIAEDVVKQEAEGLPFGVFRPSISKFLKFVENCALISTVATYPFFNLIFFFAWQIKISHKRITNIYF